MARFSLSSLPLNTLSSVPFAFFRTIFFSSAARVWSKIRASEPIYYVSVRFLGVLSEAKFF